jgi:CMP-N-acetylneuraminic acid synthetase
MWSPHFGMNLTLFFSTSLIQHSTFNIQQSTIFESISLSIDRPHVVESDQFWKSTNRMNRTITITITIINL